MLVKKIAHCCFAIEHKGRVIMTDPGSYTPQEALSTHVDIVHVSHVHGDHFIESNLKALLQKNPRLVLMGPQEVLDAADELIAESGEAQTRLIADGEVVTLDEMDFRGVGERHAEVYGEIGDVENVGFVLDESVYFTGDAFADPKMPAGETLQLLIFCITGPFTRLGESIDWAKSIKAVKAIPMHEEILVPELQDFIFSVASQAFRQHETIFIPVQKDGVVNV